MQYKTTNRLFRGQYQYKLVITCSGASFFRGGDMKKVLEDLSKVNFQSNTVASQYYPVLRTGIKTQDDLDYAFKLAAQLSALTDIDVRVESPWVSVYSNSMTDIDSVIALSEERVKYVCVPPDSNTLVEGTIIMPKMNYEFRITVGKTSQNYSAFVEWADTNKNLKLTKTCIRDLSKDNSWGGSHFYLTGNNNLLMAKMHLGSSINRVERIIKA